MDAAPSVQIDGLFSRQMQRRVTRGISLCDRFWSLVRVGEGILTKEKLSALCIYYVHTSSAPSSPSLQVTSAPMRVTIRRGAAAHDGVSKGC